MEIRNVQSGVDNVDRASIAWGATLGRLRIRAKLYLAFSAISGLVIASAITAVIWTRSSDAEIFRNLSRLEFAKRQSTVIALELMTMSDALRGYLLDTANQGELDRKFSADREFNKAVQELKVALTEMPSVLRLVVELANNDAQNVDPAENRLIALAKQNVDAAKRFYKSDYLPTREHEAGLILAIRQEVARVEEAVTVNAAQTRVRQLVAGIFGLATVTNSVGVSGLAQCADDWRSDPGDDRRHGQTCCWRHHDRDPGPGRQGRDRRHGAGGRGLPRQSHRPPAGRGGPAAHQPPVRRGAEQHAAGHDRVGPGSPGATGQRTLLRDLPACPRAASPRA